MSTLASRAKTNALRLAVALCLAATGLTIATTVSSSASGLNILTNGGFETGSFTPGWTTTNAGSGGWVVSSTGAADGGVTNAPDEGLYSALLEQTDPTSGVLLSNAFTVPSGSTLSLDFAYDNQAGVWGQQTNPFDLTLGNNNQWLRLDLIKASAAYNSLAPSDILLTLFNSQSGSPAFSQPWETLSASLASLAGQSVEIRVMGVDTDTFQPVWVDGVDVTGNLPSVTNLGVSAGPGSLTAAWAPNGNATGFTCTLMYGFNTPTTFSTTTTGTSCTFNDLAAGTTWGIQVVATSSGITSAPDVAFGTVPTVSVPTARRIVCRSNKGMHQIAITRINPHCPSGYHKIS